MCPTSMLSQVRAHWWIVGTDGRLVVLRFIERVPAGTARAGVLRLPLPDAGGRPRGLPSQRPGRER